MISFVSLASRRRIRAWGLAAALAITGTGLPALAQAAPPAAITTQVPGYYRMAVGELTVTALYDGYIDIDTRLLKGISAKDQKTLLARMFLSWSRGVQTAVNAFLIHTGEHLVLIDAGTGNAFGPTLGRISENLQAAGYRPEDVDTVLLTHLHPDHASGLLTDDGKARFPNADVRVSQLDADYWLSERAQARARKSDQPMFELARKAVAPYQASGRFKPFKAGDALLPGFTVMPAYGHTPGHSAYLLQSRNQSLLLWGDIVHSHSVQFQRPEVSLEFDVDGAKAIATRRRIFDEAARGRLWVAGAHLPFPGLGHVRAEGKRYAWVPVEFSPIRTDR